MAYRRKKKFWLSIEDAPQTKVTENSLKINDSKWEKIVLKVSKHLFLFLNRENKNLFKFSAQIEV